MDNSTLFGIASIMYILAMVLYITFFVFKKDAIGWIATVFTIIGFVAHTVSFFVRWYEFSQIEGLGLLRAVPLTNLYESIVFFVWCVILGYLTIEFKFKNRSLGAFVTPIAGMALAFIDISGMSKEIQPLVPALQSNWLLAHVTMSFIAYAAFAISFASALMYLSTTSDTRKSLSYIIWTTVLGVFLVVLIAMVLDLIFYKVAGMSHKVFLKSFLFKASFRNDSISVVLMSFIVAVVVIALVWRYGCELKRVIYAFKITPDNLDELTYKSIAVGFPVFTLGGLIFGAVWADQAWGRYWSWDPKETWSLITWFIYAFYLHARLLRGWRGVNTALIALLGFISTIFTYLGVNLLLSGLHSYGSM